MAAVSCVLIALCVCAPQPALAFELFGFRLFGRGEAEPPPPPDAVAYTTQLIVEGDSESAPKLVRRASTVIADDDELVAPATLLSLARGDYQRILAALYSEGRYGGTISITVNGQEAAGIPIDAEFSDPVEVVITVNPGPVYEFGRVTINNRAGEVPGDETLPRTPEELGLVPGDKARAGVILQSENSIVERWREKGYPKARIANRMATARHPEDKVDVSITAASGPPAVFGGTSVIGADRMDPVFVAYYAGITPGEPFDPDDLDRAREQLQRLEVFDALRIVEGDVVRSDGTLPITINVSERKRRVFGGGGNFSTRDGAGLEAFWRHRNLFGRAEKLRLTARMGGINAGNPDEYNYELSAAFLKPGVFTPYTDFLARVAAEQDAPDTYRARSINGTASLTHRIGRKITIDGGVRVEAVTIDQTPVGDGDFFIVSLPAGITWDTRDDPLNATRGFVVAARTEPLYEASFGNVGVVGTLRASTYYSVIEDRLVLAGRAEFGSIVGMPLNETPASRLFFAGGGGSIRGYDYRSVGPVDRNGITIGGRSLFTTSAEARVNVTRRIQVVPFVDAGNAFEDEFPDFSEPLRYAAGIGVRYITGLGPIRLDVATPLNPRGGDPEFAVYLGLGQAF